MFPRRYLLMVLALLGTLAISPRPLQATSAPQPISQVRVVHALPGAPAVDVFVDGARMVPGLAFGVAMPYLNLGAGPHAFSLVPVGAVPPTALVSTDLDMAPGQPYTLLALPASAAAPTPPTLLVLPDERVTPIGGPARVRFIHASPTAPTVDVVIVGAAPLATNLSFGQATPYVDVPASTASLELRVAGTDSVVLTLADTVLAVGTVYTFAVIGLTGGTPPLGALSLIDS